MAIIGFNFKKLQGERKETPKGGVEVNHSLKIDDIKKTPLTVGGSKTDVLRVDFSFDILYGNSGGKIAIAGDVIYTDTKEIIEETLKKWESEQKLASQISQEIHKFIYNKAIIKALELSDSLGLPAPVPLPKVKSDQKGQNSTAQTKNS